MQTPQAGVLIRPQIWPSSTSTTPEGFRGPLCRVSQVAGYAESRVDYGGGWESDGA